jgi:tetratricopeptide (TPR) repeat protein
MSIVAVPAALGLGLIGLFTSHAPILNARSVPPPQSAPSRPTYIILVDTDWLDTLDARKACILAGAFVDGLDPDDRVAILSVSTLPGRVDPTRDRLAAGASLESITGSSAELTHAIWKTTGLEMSLPDALAIADGDTRVLERVEKQYAAQRLGGVTGIPEAWIVRTAKEIVERAGADDPLIVGTTQLLQRARDDAGRLVIVWLTKAVVTRSADRVARLMKAAVAARAAISIVLLANDRAPGGLEGYRSLASATGGVVIPAVPSIDTATTSLLKATGGPETRRSDPAGVSELTSLRRTAERPAAGSAYLALVRQYRTGDADAAVQTLMSWAPERLQSDVRPLPSLAELGAAVALHTEVAVGTGSQAHLGISRRAVAALTSRQLGKATSRRWFVVMAGYSREEARRVEEMPDAGSDAAVMVALGSLLEFPTVADREGQSDFEQPKPPAADLSRAADFHRAALAIDNGLTEARLRLGRVLWMLHQPGEAIAELERVRSQAREPGLSYLASLFLGEIYEATGDGKAAVAAYRAAIQSCPDALAARVALAHLLQSSGRFVEAEQIVRQGLSVRPGNAARDPWQDYVWGSPAHVERDLSTLREAVRK